MLSCTELSECLDSLLFVYGILSKKLGKCKVCVFKSHKECKYTAALRATAKFRCFSSTCINLMTLSAAFATLAPSACSCCSLGSNIDFSAGFTNSASIFGCLVSRNRRWPLFQGKNFVLEEARCIAVAKFRPDYLYFLKDYSIRRTSDRRSKQRYCR